MNIIVSFNKIRSEKFFQHDSSVNHEWKNIALEHGGFCLNVFYYPDANTRVIQTDDNLWISDDKIFISDGGPLSKADDRSIIGMVEDKGIDCIRNIQSNVTLFLYDKAKDRIYLASNRVTAGRMFFVAREDSFLFGNDFAALARLQGLSLNQLSLYAYAKFGAVPEDITFDRDIKSVPVGHYAVIDCNDKKVEYVPFFKFNYNNSEGRAIDYSLLSDAEDRLKCNSGAFSDETVHMLISGGIDSSLFAFYLKEQSAKMICHYCRFGENDPEQAYAEAVADALQVPLKIHTIYDEDIIQEIEDTASNTSYPFSDFSNVSVNFLLRKIKEEFGTGATIVECNGADDGFGYAALKRIPIWQTLYKIPAPLLKLLSDFATYGDSWMYDSLIRLTLFYPYRAREKNIYKSHMTFSGGEKVFGKKDFGENDLDDMISSFFNGNLDTDHPTDYEKMNVAQFLHTCSRLWTAKGYTPAERLNLKIVYPFTWKNILEIQARMPLGMKVNDGVVKWPLKKLLEKYMSKDFIYRKKSGFAPPLLRWLKDNDNYTYFYENIMNGTAIQYFQATKIDKIFKIIKSGKKISRYALNLIWSLLFFEVWLKNNHIEPR